MSDFGEVRYSPIMPRDRVNEPHTDILARTLWGECRGERIEGQIEVAWCIRNRVEMDLWNDGKPDWWGETYMGVCLKPSQFSCWLEGDPNAELIRRIHYEHQSEGAALRRCLWVALGVMNNDLPSRFHDCKPTHYYAPKGVRNPPFWADESKFVGAIGGHRFYAGIC